MFLGCTGTRKFPKAARFASRCARGRAHSGGFLEGSCRGGKLGGRGRQFRALGGDGNLESFLALMRRVFLVIDGAAGHRGFQGGGPMIGDRIVGPPERQSTQLAATPVASSVPFCRFEKKNDAARDQCLTHMNMLREFEGLTRCRGAK